jgi:hypothetical protein
MEQALRCDISIFDFYQMTPREVYAVIDATNWRADKEQQQAMSIAWLNAVLQRTKRIPGLRSLLAKIKKPKKLTGKQLQERRREFAEIATPGKLARINKAMRQRNG